MSQLNNEILDILQNDSRLSYADIATMVGVSESEVTAVIKMLEETGVIIKYTTVINDEVYENGNSRVRALVELDVCPQKTTGYDAIAKAIYQYPEVVGHYLVSGQYDFLVIVESSSHKNISHFVSDKLATLENVTGTNTHFIFKKYKENGVTIDESDSISRIQVMP